MATSAEIAQQIADQNSWFMQQQAVSAQVGVNPGAYGGGMGSWNAMAPRGAPAMQPAPGQTMPGAFSYGGTYGYGLGNRMGAMAAAGGSALPFAASMFGGNSPMFNPASGFMAARTMGLGVGASLGAAGLMMAPVSMGAHAIGAMAGGAGQAAMAATAVSNYGFANQQSQSGQGFSRQDALNIGRQVRQLGTIPELMTSFEEISRILPQLKQMGAMSGVRDAAEFNRRMKEAIGSIRDVSKIIGASMEEAAQFFSHSQRVGFFGRKDQISNAMNVRMTQSMTGMDRDQVMQMQEQGAAFGTAIGGSRRLGTQAYTAAAQRIGLAVQGNDGLRETIANITGKAGEEGIGDAAGMLTNLGMRVAGTGPGRFMLAGFMKRGEDGQVSIDSDLMQRHLRGDVSMDEIRRRGSKMMGDRKNVISFERHQTKLAQQFAEQGGGEAMLQLLGDAVGTDTDAATYLLQSQYGASEEQADLVAGLLKDRGGGMGEQKQAVMEIIRRQAQRRENGPGGMMRKMGQRMSNTITEPFRKAGADMWGDVTQWVDEIYEDAMGDFVAKASKLAQEDFTRALHGNKGDSLRTFTQSSGTMRGVSMTSQISDAFKSTEVYAMMNKTARTTGRTSEGQFDHLRKLAGSGGASDSDLGERYKKMASGSLSDMGAMLGTAENSATVNKGAAALADRIAGEMANDPDFINATPAEKLDRMRAIANSTMAGGDITDATRLIGKYSQTEGATGLVMRAQAALKERGIDINLDQLTDTGAQGLDPTAVVQNMRDARHELGKTFGSASALIEKSGAVQGMLKDFYDNKGGNAEESSKRRQAIINALNSGNASEVRKLTGQSLSAEEMTEMGAALSHAQKGRFNAELGSKAFGDYMGAVTGEAQLAYRSTLGDVSKESAAAAEGMSGDLQKAVSAFGDAAGDLGGALGSNKASGAFDAMSSKSDAVAAAIDKITDPEEREKAIKSLPRALQVAVRRRAGAKKGIQGLVRKGTSTVADLMSSTGLSEKEITDVTGVRGKDSIVGIDEDMGRRLERAAGSSGLGAGLGAQQQAEKQQAKEEQQLVLMKTMTEALIAIAKKQGSGYSGPSEEYTTNKNLTEKTPPDGKSGG